MCKTVCMPVRVQSQVWPLPQDDRAKDKRVSPEPQVGRHSRGPPRTALPADRVGSQAPEQLGFISF